MMTEVTFLCVLSL